MSRYRTVYAPVSYFPLPKGTHPKDKVNTEKVAAMYRTAMGAEVLSVDLNQMMDGTELLDQYKIELAWPDKIGSFVSLSALGDQEAKLIGDLIKGLANDQNVHDTIEKLESVTGNPDNDSPFDSDSKPPPPTGDEAGLGHPVKDDLHPDKGKQKLPPFLASQEPPKEICATKLSEETGLSEEESLHYVEEIRKFAKFSHALPWLKGEIVAAEGEEPFTDEEYKTICAIARGDGLVPLEK